MRCGKCRSMAYCTPECQRLDWAAGHRLECDVYKNAKTFTGLAIDGTPSSDAEEGLQDEYVRMTMRLWLLNRADSSILSSPTWTLHNGKQISFWDIPNNVECYSTEQASFLRTVFASIFISGNLSFVIGLKPSGPHYTEQYNEELLAIYGRLVGSSPRLKGGVYMRQKTSKTKRTWHKELSVTDMFFVEVTPFPHSCRPNAIAATDTMRLAVRATHPIREGDPIWIDFIPPFQPYESRYYQLKAFPLFYRCTCPRCEDARENPDSQPSLEDYRRLMLIIDESMKTIEGLDTEVEKLQRKTAKQEQLKAITNGMNGTSRSRSRELVMATPTIDEGNDLEAVMLKIEEAISFMGKCLAPVRFHISIARLLHILFALIEVVMREERKRLGTNTKKHRHRSPQWTRLSRVANQLLEHILVTRGRDHCEYKILDTTLRKEHLSRKALAN